MSEEREVGLRCKACGCRQMKVVWTRHRSNKIVRMRSCRHCGTKRKTTEG